MHNNQKVGMQVVPAKLDKEALIDLARSMARRNFSEMPRSSEGVLRCWLPRTAIWQRYRDLIDTPAKSFCLTKDRSMDETLMPDFLEKLNERQVRSSRPSSPPRRWKSWRPRRL